MSSPVGAVTKKPAPSITQDDVNTYAAVNAAYNQSKKDRDKLREPIIEALEAGIRCPTQGPYLINLSYQERSINQWKDICETVISTLGERQQKKARALVAQMIAVKDSVPQITVQVNPQWEGQL